MLIFLYWYGTPLPAKTHILNEILHGAPQQTEDESVATPFPVKFGEFEYTFTPHASYELSGLVVSLHHSDSWIDISHEGDPAQTVDICVVWGPNIATGGYKMVTYAHGDWTCYYRWETEADPPFSGSVLSHNHLLPTTPALASLVKSIKVGDQIRLSGLLVDYTITASSGARGGSRNTSLIRTDNGNGACEIIYLTGATILKRNMPWRDPLRYLLFMVMIFGALGSFYFSLPEIIKVHDEVAHSKNPYDVKNYLKHPDLKKPTEG